MIATETRLWYFANSAPPWATSVWAMLVLLTAGTHHSSGPGSPLKGPPWLASPSFNKMPNYSHLCSLSLSLPLFPPISTWNLDVGEARAGVDGIPIFLSWVGPRSGTCSSVTAVSGHGYTSNLALGPSCRSCPLIPASVPNHSRTQCTAGEQGEMPFRKCPWCPSLSDFLFGDPSGMRRMRVKLPFLPLPWFSSMNRG